MPIISNNIILKKSYAFALATIELYKNLKEKKEFILSKQVLRSGTAIGANIREAMSGQSKKDFIHKLEIAQKEIRETWYWLHLLFDSGYIQIDTFQCLAKDCEELNRILSSIIITTKQRYFKQQNA